MKLTTSVGPGLDAPYADVIGPDEHAHTPDATAVLLTLGIQSH